jgi:eukaryotic-like serine/threonine-protein kinase
MDELTSSEPETSTQSPWGRIDAACDRFEIEYRAGRSPRIEDYLNEVAEVDRPALLRELVAVDLELRRLCGESPAAYDYLSRFRGREAVINAAFGEARRGPGSLSGAPASQSGAGSVLFGTFALQNNFVSHDAVLSAFEEWSHDTARSMVDVLRAKGDLDGERLTLVAALFAEHLRNHGEDPIQGLKALSAFDSLRKDLERLEAPDLKAVLSQVSIVTGSSGEVDNDTVLFEPEGRVPPRIRSRFHVLRPHRRGGLGEVFVARDLELNRDVALKQIIADQADDPVSRARFMLEAEVTGGLEHPGVVPVYGLGTYEDGRPYYAMRFVKGDSLRDAVTRFFRGEPSESDLGARRLALRQLLGRFVDVCDAVAYAHSRGVLHRDIKPGNILLGPYGETLVVDWGLAKVIGRSEVGTVASAAEATLRPPSAGSSDATRPGSQIGTPAYMSPEQAAGAVDQLGVATDVYSLGATLFYVLTGRAPFSGRTEAIIQAVSAGNFPRPRQVIPTAPAGLEAICLKATALRPEDRYRSARALALDVEHWLADEPVSALPERPLRRMGRWFRRHRGFAASAAAALVVVAVVSLVAAIAVGRAWRFEKSAKTREFQAREAESQARAEAQRQRDVAKVAAKEAHRQRAVAESNFELASQALEQVLLVADGTLAAIPGREQQRRALAESALNSAMSLLRSRPDDASLRYLTSRVERLVGNTNRGTGRFDRARAVHLAAVDRLRGLAKQNPDVTRYRDRLAELHAELSETLRLAGRSRLAEPYARTGLAVAVALRAENPNRPEFVATTALCLYTLAEVELASGKPGEAVRDYDAASDLLESLSKNDRLPRPTIPLELAMVLYERGDALRDDGRAPASEGSIRQSLATTDKLLAADVSYKNDVRYVRSGAQLALARTLALAADRRDEARRAFDESVEGFSSLAKEFPWLADYRKSLALALEARAASRGETREAEDDLDRARTLVERLVAESRDAPSYNGLLGLVLGRMGLVARSHGDPVNARKLLNDAVTHQNKALAPDANPGSLLDKAALQRHEDALKELENPKAGRNPSEDRSGNPERP